MKEMIDPVANNTPSVMLVNAMSAACGKDDLVKLFGLTPSKDMRVEVELFVNGVPVPFMQTMTEAWQVLSDQLERNIREKALELVKGTKLAELMGTLENAHWAIEEEMRKAGLL